MFSFSNIADIFSSIIQLFVDLVTSVVAAMEGLVNGLEYVDNTIIGMKNLDLKASSGDVVYPVVQAVATVKYLMPADIFYFIYLFILIGISLSIYKIISYMITTLIPRLIPDVGYSKSSILSWVKNKFRI